MKTFIKAFVLAVIVFLCATVLGAQGLHGSAPGGREDGSPCGGFDTIQWNAEKGKMFCVPPKLETSTGELVKGTITLSGLSGLTPNWQTYTFANPSMKIEPAMRIVFDDKADVNTLVCYKNQCKCIEELFPPRPQGLWLGSNTLEYDGVIDSYLGGPNNTIITKCNTVPKSTECK